MAVEKPLTKKVKIDLEIDTDTVNSGSNPYKKMIHLAAAVDAWRIFQDYSYLYTYSYCTKQFFGIWIFQHLLWNNPVLSQ